MNIILHLRTCVILGCIFAASCLCSCALDKGDLITKDSLSEKLPLNEVFLLDSSFSISIPENYRVQVNNGVDFSVFYFVPIDSISQPKYFGGVYFGNHPGLSDKEIDSCTNSKMKGKVLGKIEDWSVRKCSGEYHIELITDSESGEEWNKYIYAFGGAVSEEDLGKLVYIFSTLKKSG